MPARSRLRLVALAAALLVAGLASVSTAVATPTSTAAASPPPTIATSPSPEPTEQAVGGTLRDGEDEPVPDVTITVSAADGDEVGSDETNEDGQWQVPLPGPGTYRVELDAETLPDDVELRDPERNPLEIQVRSGQTRPAIFLLGEGADGRGQLEAIGRAFGNGVKVGLIIAMAAVGLSLIFGTTGLINFAHGELIALGAMLTWYFNVSDPRLQLIPAAGVAIILTGLLGAGLERGLFRPLRYRRVGLFQLLIITIGLSLVIRHLLLLFFGGSPRTYRDYVGQTAIQIGPISLTPRDLVIMLLSVLLLSGVASVLQLTRIGKAVRAVADNPALASASGIDIDRVILFVWISGAALAASGGIFFGSAVSADYYMGFRLLLLMFAAVILGGIGTAYGAMAGGLVIGLVTEMSVIWFPAEMKFLWALLVLVVVLLVRPQGILGRRERIG